MDDDFDIDFKFLPPRLQVRLWVLALDANTSKVNLAYKRNGFRASFGYNYGGNLEANAKFRRFSTKLSVSPSTGDLDLGIVFRGFRFGVSPHFSQQSLGLSFGYGAPLLPFPSQLSGVFNSAAVGLQSVVGDIGSAPDNPLQWYNLHSDDISTVTQAISTGKKIHKVSQSPQRFGMGLRLNYTPTTGLVIYGGAQYLF